MHKSKSILIKTVEVIRLAARDVNLSGRGYRVDYICKMPSSKHCGKFVGRFNIVKEVPGRNQFKLYKVIHVCMEPGCGHSVDFSFTGKTK